MRSIRSRGERRAEGHLSRVIVQVEGRGLVGGGRAVGTCMEGPSRL
jgi:hypothetical protein